MHGYRCIHDVTRDDVARDERAGLRGEDVQMAERLQVVAVVHRVAGESGEKGGDEGGNAVIAGA